MTAIAMNALSRRAFLSSTGALVVALAAPAELAAAAAEEPGGRTRRCGPTSSLPISRLIRTAR